MPCGQSKRTAPALLSRRQACLHLLSTMRFVAWVKPDSLRQAGGADRSETLPRFVSNSNSVEPIVGFDGQAGWYETGRTLHRWSIGDSVEGPSRTRSGFASPSCEQDLTDVRRSKASVAMILEAADALSLVAYRTSNLGTRRTRECPDRDQRLKPIGLGTPAASIKFHSAR